MPGETVTRLRRTTSGDDRYGEPVYDDPPAQTVLDGAFFDPGGSQEPVEPGRAAVITQPTVYFPGAWPDIAATDQLVIRTRTYDVVGDPGEWRSPWGSSVGGLVVPLKRVTG